MVEPKSYVYHVGGGTLPKSNPMKTYLNFRNNLTMLYKNLPAEDLKPVMRMRLFLDRNLGEAKAVWRGRRDFHRWHHDFDKDRKLVMSASHTPAPLSPFSILWKYYAKGKKTFSQL